jgi:hypothetical protein
MAIKVRPNPPAQGQGSGVPKIYNSSDEPDDELRFEAAAAMVPEEQEMAKAVLDAIIVKSQFTGALKRVGKTATKTNKTTRMPNNV